MVKFRTKKALKIFKALANETRLKLLELIYEGETGMCDILPYIKKSQSLVSNQLSKLKSLDLIESRKEGKHVRFKIVDNDLKKILRIILEKDKNRRR